MEQKGKNSLLDTLEEEFTVRKTSFHCSKRSYCHFLRLKNYQILSLKKYQCRKFEILKNEKVQYSLGAVKNLWY